MFGRLRQFVDREPSLGQPPMPNPVRYAVVGLGHIAQQAVLPAFANARRNSRLEAVVSGDEAKRREVGDRYGVEHRCSYGEYDDLLRGGSIDAVYIALPNSMHAEFTIRAAQAGVHVLCEKPMAMTERECLNMIEACRAARVKLMIAYRLHFEEANLRAVEIVRSGRIGRPRTFNSVFTMNVNRGNVRLIRELGGGTLYDIGIYCINAARYLFADEPFEVVAASVSRPDSRFSEVDEMTAAVLRFPDWRLASFTCSFGAADVSQYQIVGTDGDLRLDPAYEWHGSLRHTLTVDGQTETRTFGRRDQFGPELAYFSDCIIHGWEPQPSGEEGLADVRIIRALYYSARTGLPVRLDPFPPAQRPSRSHEFRMPPVRAPQSVHAQSPSA